MKGIKNLQYQSGTGQLFRLIVNTGSRAGAYDIVEPDGFEDINIIVDINEEFFNVDNFILGESTKIKFLEYADKKTFELIKNIYETEGGDGQIIFKWIFIQNGVEKDILGNGFELNLNKYKMVYEQSGRVIELEVKKREAQNKLLTREDVTVNLFAEKNLDDKPIEKVKTEDIILKTEYEEVRAFWYLKADEFSNDYNNFENVDVLDGGNIEGWGMSALRRWTSVITNTGYFFPIFSRSEENSDFGEGSFGVGYRTAGTSVVNSYGTEYRSGQGKSAQQKIFEGKTPMLVADENIKGLRLSISNFDFRAIERIPKDNSRIAEFLFGDRNNYGFDFRLKDFNEFRFPFVLEIIKETRRGVETVLHSIRSETMENSQWEQMKFVNQLIEIGDLEMGDKIYAVFTSGHYGNALRDLNFVDFYCKNPHPSFKLFYNINKPARKSRVIPIYEALQKVIENYTDGQIGLRSRALVSGEWKNQKIATGMFLRSVANIFIGEEKINTSFKSLFYDGTAPLLGLGFDVVDDSVIVEGVKEFFRPILAYDFTDKDFVQDTLSLENDLDLSFNHLIFGTKKYSTKKKGDLKNFNTQMECVTPIKSAKKKLDKTTDLIIDEYKIRDLLDDKTTQTNENDDDLVLLDTVYLTSYTESAQLSDITHTVENGVLVLKAKDTPWDILPLEVGTPIYIVSDLNNGAWKVSKINSHSLYLEPDMSRLDFGANPQPGTGILVVSYELQGVIKSRSIEGDITSFNTNGYRSPENYRISNIDSEDIVLNVRHNPRYQAKRWFSFFGSGLSKKAGTDIIKINKYKNNGAVRISRGFGRGAVVDILNEDFVLSELRENEGETFFNGEKIEITLTNVSFEEFYKCYYNWKYGENYQQEKLENANSENTNAQRLNYIKGNRGYIKVRVLEEDVYLYPFGSGAFDYDKGAMELTIKGKIHKYEAVRGKIFDETFDETFE